jgi:hypothetical protein
MTPQEQLDIIKRLSDIIPELNPQGKPGMHHWCGGVFVKCGNYMAPNFESRLAAEVEDSDTINAKAVFGCDALARLVGAKLALLIEEGVQISKAGNHNWQVSFSIKEADVCW